METLPLFLRSKVSVVYLHHSLLTLGLAWQLVQASLKHAPIPMGRMALLS